MRWLELLLTCLLVLVKILLQSDGKLWNYVDEDLRWKNDFEIRHAEEQVKNAEKWADHYREILMNLQNKDQ
jgi:hypothetical protein